MFVIYLQRLLLDGLLQVNVGLVGDIQGHFQFGDVDLHLLLDPDDFGLQPCLGLDDASAELLDLNAGLFAEEGKSKGSVYIAEVTQILVN